MQQKLCLGVSQKLSIAPSIQQALKILQLSNLDLKDEINDALEDNILLESVAYDFNNDTNFDIYSAEVFVTNKNFDYDDKDSFIQTFSTNLTLKQHILSQFKLANFSKKDTFIAKVLIDHLDDNGYITNNLEDIAKSINYEECATVDDVLVVLHYIQSLEPCGVGARNLKECLMLQLNNLPLNTPWCEQAFILVDKYLNEIANGEYKLLQEKLKLKENQLKSVIALIKSLHPKPGLLFNNSESQELSVDLTIKKQDDGLWKILLNQRYDKKIKLSSSYKEVLKASSSSNDSVYYKSMYAQAKSLIYAIKERNSTLLKVANAIFSYQSEFLEYGENAIKPLSMQSLAKKLSLNISTISRAIANKYINTPFGNFELKHFIARKAKTDNSKTFSTRQVLELLESEIKLEDKYKPLSDQELVQNLAKNGIVLARRTVAKYREILGIPSSSFRKISLQI